MTEFNGEKGLVEHAEDLGGVVKDVQIDVPQEPQEKAEFPKENFIEEEVGGRKEYIGVDGTRYDEYGNVIRKGSGDDTEDPQ